jgi:hypothetical protein
MTRPFNAGAFTFHPLAGPDGAYVEQQDLWGQRRCLIEVRTSPGPREYCELGRPAKFEVRLVPVEEARLIDLLLRPA